jgi:hypothetical protein
VSPDVFIHADGTVETRSRTGLPDREFWEPVPKMPRVAYSLRDLSETAERGHWVRTWVLLRTAPGDGQAATHGVRIWVEKP